MKNRYLINKILTVIIILLPVVYWSGCKKQAKCGCDKKDVVATIDSLLLDHSDIYYTDSTNAVFQMGYNTYYFCNPVEMYSKYKSINSDDQLLISGFLYWECNFLMNSSSSSYYNYKVYNIDVTLLEPYLYGKK